MFLSPAKVSNRRRGMSMVEILVALSIAAMAVLGTTSLLISDITGVNRVTVNLTNSEGAATAMRSLNATVEEAKTVNVPSPTEIDVFYPMRDANGAYQRAILDPNSRVRYYLGSVANGPDPKSTKLILEGNDGRRRVLCSNVKQLVFSLPQPYSLAITLQTAQSGRQYSATSSFVSRDITLRNYS
jgi:prepilin-type N-terminal cleavage/methylation domain-containing protein